MNYYAKAIEIIGFLDRKLSTAEVRIAMNHPSVFVAAFNPEKLYSVILTDRGDKPIACIKEIRTITEWGLKEAKEASEHCPVVIVQNATAAHAMKIVRQFAEIGATAITELQTD